MRQVHLSAIEVEMTTESTCMLHWASKAKEAEIKKQYLARKGKKEKWKPSLKWTNKLSMRWRMRMRTRNQKACCHVVCMLKGNGLVLKQQGLNKLWGGTHNKENRLHSFLVRVGPSDHCHEKRERDGTFHDTSWSNWYEWATFLWNSSCSYLSPP